MRIKTITYSDVLAKALPVLLARTFAHHYSILQKSVAKFRVFGECYRLEALRRATLEGVTLDKHCFFLLFKAAALAE
jgi:hypothetical protein